MKKIIMAFVLGAAAVTAYAAVRAPVRYSVSQQVTVRPLDGSTLAQLQASLVNDGYTVISQNTADNSIVASKVILLK